MSLPRSFVVVLMCSLTASAGVPPADDWAYRPVRRQQPPVGGHPIDAFVRAKLAEHKLTLAAPADKSTLLRRVTYDLTGLPPTPAELDQFLQDGSPEAYSRVVDRLLASPRFGERVALWWLDLVRYADSDGFKADDPRPNAWRYRDYVIDSFNADKPYDRFVLEQLAGDELFPTDPAAMIATGFLRHYPDEYNAVNLEQRRQEILNDITDTTAATFLGTTLACAKCHDHKTDPILQTDYYRVQAFFAGFWPTEVVVSSTAETAAHAEQLKAWEARTETVRREMAALEQPFRLKAEQKQRSRFDEDYAKLLDIPFDNRSPVQKQIAAMIERQVYAESRFNPSQMKGDVKTQWERLNKQLSELAKSKPAPLPTAMIMTDVGPTAPVTKKLKRGNWQKPGEEIEPGFLSAIDDREADVTPVSSSSGRRSAFARWVVGAKNPLTSRVIVNRVWQQLFARGLVASASDFGVTGDRPSHPELLDWLATELTTPETGTPWALKRIYKLIVTSDTYRQTSRTTTGVSVDPDNRWLWRSPRKRLDGESLRDAMLAVSGRLNPKAGGPAVFPDLPSELQGTAGWKPTPEPSERDRRSVYVSVKRNLRYPFFVLFDAPDRSETCSRRFVTTTAPQALGLLNDEMVLGLAVSFAEQLTRSCRSTDEAVERLFRTALGREPTVAERTRLTNFLLNHTGTSGEALTDACHAVLNLNEFLYID